MSDRPTMCTQATSVKAKNRLKRREKGEREELS